MNGHKLYHGLLVSQNELMFSRTLQFIYAIPSGDKQMIAQPLTISEMPNPAVGIIPTFELAREDTQDLFDSLWRLGFRPQDGTGNSGHIESLKYHLEDMRKLVFNDSKDGSSNG